MSLQIEGKIERQGFGSGTWALVGSQGTTYELYQSPADLHKAGLRVSITGQIREDIATLAMIGPVLEVQTFKILD